MHLITSFRYQHNNVSSWHNTILVTCLGNHHLAGEWNWRPILCQWKFGRQCEALSATRLVSTCHREESLAVASLSGRLLGKCLVKTNWKPQKRAKKQTSNTLSMASSGKPAFFVVTFDIWNDGETPRRRRLVSFWTRLHPFPTVPCVFPPPPLPMTNWQFSIWLFRVEVVCCWTNFDCGQDTEAAAYAQIFGRNVMIRGAFGWVVPQLLVEYHHYTLRASSSILGCKIISKKYSTLYLKSSYGVQC